MERGSWELLEARTMEIKIGLAILLLAILWLMGCTPADPFEPEAAGDGVEPTPLPTLDPDAPLLPDVAWYAEEMGVSREEAAWRLEMQQALGELRLEPRLREQEAETFAGLWLQHRPEFRLVVAFTGGGEETMRPYLEGEPVAGLVEVRDGYTYTLAELLQAQETAMAVMQELGVGASGGIDQQENRVVLTVGNPQLLQEELDVAGVALPEPVVVEAISPENLASTLRGDVEIVEGPAGQTIYLPKQAPTDIYLEGEVRGTLLLDENGCLRVASEWEDAAYLVLWRADHTLRFGEGIEVVDGSGQVVARAGEEIRGGGGYLSGQDPAIPGMPIEACPGPYITLGELPSLAVQAIPDVYVQPFRVDDSARAGLFFSQSRAAPEEEEISGTLVVEERCLRVDGYTVLWPPDLYPDEEAEPLAVVYRVPDEPAREVAVVGEEVVLPGSERTAVDYRYFENKVECPGPYWGVSEVESRE